MPHYHLGDTVALKQDGNFTGTVDRTAQFEAEPVEDCLIIKHTEVPTQILTDFLLTGTVPTDYAFVQFAQQDQGHALVSEDDLVLIDRNLDLGDVVKKGTHAMTGYVVDVQNTYILDPIWLPSSSQSFAAIASSETKPDLEPETGALPLPPHITHPRPHTLIHNVPFEELKRAQDFIEGDYVLQQDWIGSVEGYEMNVVLLLEDNSIVQLHNADDIYIPVPDFKKDLVLQPEIDGLARPPQISTLQGWPQLVPPEDLECGQYIVTDMRNIHRGRFLNGSFNSGTKPQGRILMSRCRRLDIRWLLCNPYMPEYPWESDYPENILPYENLTTFTQPQEIRRDSRLVLYDPSRKVITTKNKSRSAPVDRPIDKTSASINLSSTFSVGDQVKFRDSAGAAVKYQGHERAGGGTSNAFHRIMHQDAHGYDLNEFKVVHSRQIALVRWQDGSVTEQPSATLTKVELFEADLAPADIVVAREGMMQQAEEPLIEHDQIIESPLVPFNEMTFLEQPYDLHPARVGVVQVVNPTERLAQIRWFQQPKIRITTAGHGLGGDSRFGAISDQIEDVSLYEIMSFPGLTRKLRDIVMIPPSTPSAKAVEILNKIEKDDLLEYRASITALSLIPRPGGGTRDLLEWMQHNASSSHGPKWTGPCVEKSQYKPHKSIDWVGEICQLSLDGSVTIRVNVGAVGSEDIIVDHDQMLAFVDGASCHMDMDDDPMDVDVDLDMDDDYSLGEEEKVLEEEVLYEGGERLDNDPGDENWESADDEDDAQISGGVGDSRGGRPNLRKRSTDVTMSDADEDTPEVQRAGTDGGKKKPQQTEGGIINTLARVFTGAAASLSPLILSQQSSNPAREVAAETRSSSRLPNAETETKLDMKAETKVETGTLLRSHLPTSPPPPFAILDINPPPDQYDASTPAPTQISPSFLKRITREHKILSSSLPTNSIYVRTYSSRLDLLRILLLGPLNTPYEHAPFIIDLRLPSTFPSSPPTAHFHSWTSGMGRINPNLYEEGKICLSLLGTWPGKSSSESWTEKSSTLLQLVLSLQALVLVKAPFFNEAGFEGYEDMKPDQGGYRIAGLQYAEKAFVMARGFVRHACERPVGGLEDVVAWIYLDHRPEAAANTAADESDTSGQSENTGLLSKVIQRGNELIQRSQTLKTRTATQATTTEIDTTQILLAGNGVRGRGTDEFLMPLSQGALVMLRKVLGGLEEVRVREGVGVEL